MRLELYGAAKIIVCSMKNLQAPHDSILVHSPLGEKITDVSSTTVPSTVSRGQPGFPRLIAASLPIAMTASPTDTPAEESSRSAGK